MSEKEYLKKLARTIIRAGPLPFPITDALLSILKLVVTEEEGKFISIAFRRPNVNIDQIKKKTAKHYSDSQVDDYLNILMNNGVITGVPSRSTGIMVYHLMPFFPGIFEFQMMKGEKGEKQKKLALAFDTIFGELSNVSQANYDSIVEQFKHFPAMDRVVPVEEEISEIAEVKSDVILPFEAVHKILDDQDTFCIVHCYCRHEKDLLGRSCKVTDDRENCCMFGKTAQFAIDHNFGKQVTKEEMHAILKKTEAQGLVHKAIHIGLDPKKEIEGICNCCKCCCGIFELYYRGITPLMTYTSYITKVIEDDCVGCGTCVEKCPVEAIEIDDAVAVIDEEKCIGCGVCVHFCPEDALKLERTGDRMVYVPPPKLDVVSK